MTQFIHIVSNTFLHLGLPHIFTNVTVRHSAKTVSLSGTEFRHVLWLYVWATGLVLWRCGELVPVERWSHVHIPVQSTYDTNTHTHTHTHTQMLWAWLVDNEQSINQLEQNAKGHRGQLIDWTNDEN